MSLRRRALFLAGLFVAVSCSDAGNPLEPGPTPQPRPEDALQALDCSLAVANGSLSCAPAQPGAGDAQGAGSIFVGGQNVYVQLAASNFQNLGPDSLKFDVTVRNLIPQALGTDDGVTEHPDGVRVFFLEDPVSNPGGLPAEVANPSGVGIFTGANQPYFEYDTLIKPDSVTAPLAWKLTYTPGTSTIFFRVLIATRVQYEAGWVDVTPKADTLAPGGTVDLNSTTRNKLGQTTGVNQSVSWSSNNTSVATVDASTGVVTAVAAGTAVITATPPGAQAPGSATIVVNTEPAFVVQTIDAISNVTIPEPAPGLLTGASDGDGHSVSAVPDTVTTAKGGTAWISANGSLEYLSKSGFVGQDTIPFELFDGVSRRPAYAVADVAASNYWYVQPGGTGDGRDRFPFGSLSQAQDSAAAGDSILVLTNGVQQVSGSVTLEANQALLGQGIPASITRTVNGQTVTILAAGSAPGITNPGAGATVTLGSDNIIRGVGITASNGAAIASAPAGFVSLNVSQVAASAGGAVLDLNDGALTAVFTSLSSTSSAGAGLSLEDVTGSLTSTGGAISGATGTAFEVIGGSVSVTYGGNVTKSSAGALLSVAGSHGTGTLAFNGTLTATAGSGLLFNDADGTYSFNGTTTLSGGPGVDIGNGSDGVFTFSSDADITNSTSTAFAVNGSTATVTYNGDITQGSNALLVSVTEESADSVIFQTGTLSATNGGGILLSNADGVVRFKGTTTLDGADVGVDIIAGSDGVISFDAATIDNDNGTGLNVSESAPTLAFAGSITTGAGSPVVVDAASPCGTVSVSASISSTGQGIRVQDCNAGTVSFTGTKTLNTGANAGVTLTNNTGTAAVSLTGGALSVTTGAGGTGILGNGAGGFGTLTVSNATINSTGGPALNLTNGTLTGTFTSLTSASSATSGVSLTTVNGTLNVNGGSISGATGTAFSVSGGNLAGTIAASITQNNNASTLAVAGGHNTGTLTFSGSVSAGNGNGLQFTDADGTYTFTGNFSLNGAGDEGIDLSASSTGTVNVTPSAGNTAEIVSPSGIAISIAGGSLNYSGNVTQASNAALLSVTGGVTGHTGTVTFPSGTLSASNGNGLQFDNADGTYTFGGTVTLNGGDAGIDVTNGSAGTFSFPVTASITSPSTGNLISILNSAPNFTYTGGLTKANNNVTGILISSNTGGTITFNGDATSADGDPADVARTISSGTAAAVNLSSNGGATINFSGGGLNLTSGSGAGFTATGGGTVSVTGAGNTVNSTGGGTAVNIQSTTIGGSGVSFLRVDATGSGANGIVLSNTGAGGFQVTGDGASDPANTTRGRTTARSGGGTIVLGSGGTISGRSGDAVSLSTTGAVILRNLLIQSNTGDGVQATTVSGLTIDNTRITGHTDNSGLFFTGVSAPVVIHSEIENNAFGAGAPGADIHNVRLISNTGTGSVESSVIANTSAGAERQLQIFSTTGTLNITVTNNRIGGSTVGDGVGVYAFGSSSITANFQNDSIHNNSSFGIDSGTETTQSSSLNLTVNNTKFRNNFVGVTVAHGSSGTNTFNVTNNNFQNHGSVSININRLGAVSFSSFGLFSGTVSGNVIGTAGVANSGSPLGSNTIDVKTNGNGGTTQVAIVNNTIREIGNDGIRVIGRDANVGHTLHARIQNNNIANFHASALTGIRGELGAASGDKITMCLNISGNTVTNAPQNGVRVRSVAGGSPPPQITLTMPAYDGTGATYLANQNPAATGLLGNTSFSNANAGSTTTAGNCTTP